MFPHVTRRSALSVRSIPVPLGPRLLHSTTPAFQQQQQQDAGRPRSNRMLPRRVKTPWIEALTKSREEARAIAGGLKSADVAGQVEGAGKKRAEVDSTPKRMADSFYSVVCIALDCPDLGGNLWIRSPWFSVLMWHRSFHWRKIDGCWIVT